MRVYLAARYSRREELCRYREQLWAKGIDVQARWLDRNHQLSDAGHPIGDNGEALVEHGGHEAATMRAKFAQDDFEDVSAAQVVISFTEPPRHKATRGGRHVEFGLGLGHASRMIVVGPRENIFHWLPSVEVYETFDDCLMMLAARQACMDNFEVAL